MEGLLDVEGLGSSLEGLGFWRVWGAWRVCGVWRVWGTSGASYGRCEWDMLFTKLLEAYDTVVELLATNLSYASWRECRKNSKTVHNSVFKEFTLSTTTKRDTTFSTFVRDVIKCFYFRAITLRRVFCLQLVSYYLFGKAERPIQTYLNILMTESW